jgi:type III restriction enzyme
MIISNKVFNTQELVLQVNSNYDTSRLKLREWERFISLLCANRPYQKEAIKSAIIYLASGKYKSIEDLVSENSRKNPQIQTRYHSLQEYNKKIQIPNRLSATIDLATGAGKSFVMYGIAQIALGIGLVEKALVLCPSLTIKDELTRKFLSLATDSRLLNAIPQGAHFANPRIINADETIRPGDICVSNIHAVYSNNASSILDSLGFGKGQSCLVLSDEVHHAYNRTEGRDEESQSIKKWKEFLLDSSYDFRHILGFTGTAYIDDEYFNDVIYRYSLRQAIEERYVKSVQYVQKDDSNNEDEKFQKIYQNHIRNKESYPDVKPLSILITRDIKLAKQLNTRLVEFLAKKGEGTEEEIAKNKVLIITSHKDHKLNVLKLPYVDTDKSTEWIISVAMLTEGWDVKNVFQIVPMEEKAFNSKLLIAQVLGRGLRLPLKYPQAQVIVFNHDSWSNNIAELVKEILEIELRLKNSSITEGTRTDFHFTLHNFNYDKTPTATSAPETKVFNYKDTIALTSETFERSGETELVSIDGTPTQVTYRIEKEKYPISEIVDRIIREFETREWEGVTLRLQEHEYTKNDLPPREEIEALIRRSMNNVGLTGEYLGKTNRQAIFSTFNTLLRRASKSIIHTKKANPIFKAHTKEREHESISILSLRQANATVFYTSEYESEIVLEDTRTDFEEVLKDDTLPRRSLFKIENLYNFKTPIDLVFVSHEPERKFVEHLCKQENAEHLSAWVKSTNQNFYTVSYAMSTIAGRHTTQHAFNPDFFIKLPELEGVEYIIAVETKANGDDSDENKAKYRYASDHFRELNQQLQASDINQKYIFHFVSPANYPDFFEYLRDGRLQQHKFKSELEKLLAEEIDVQVEV